MNIALATLTSRADNSNSTGPLSWIPHSTTRSVYDIITTCFSTMIICVWSALHMNIPTRPRGFVKTFLIKVGWVVLGILMPDLLLLVAVCELWAAIKLLRNAYRYIPGLPRPRGWFYTRVLLRRVSPAYYHQVNIFQCAFGNHATNPGHLGRTIRGTCRWYIE